MKDIVGGHWMDIVKWSYKGALLLTGAFLLSGVAGAATVGAGTFNLGGTATGSTGGVAFYYAAPGDQKAAIEQPTGGVFAGLASGTLETVQDLTVANGVVPGTSFDFMNFIQLTDGINLDVTSIPIPSFPVCPTSGSVANGFECLVNAASPVVLTQGGAGVSARFSLYGDAHYAGDSTLTPFTAILNAPSTSFATVADFETYFDTHGQIPSVSFAGSFTTTATPEPASLGFIALGLIGVGFYRRTGKKV